MDNRRLYLALATGPKAEYGVNMSTVVNPLSDNDHWDILNVLCTFLPHLAPVNETTNLIKPKKASGLYTSAESATQLPLFAANLNLAAGN